VIDRALVFTRTKHGADKVVKTLAKSNIAAQAIHGNKSQNHRERTLAAFRTGEIRTLVATDIAARGIDVDGISHVVNFDLPNVPETYVHRIGRTARAGSDGVAISLVDAEELAYLRDIEKLIRQDLPREDQRSGDTRTHAERTGDIRNHQERRERRHAEQREGQRHEHRQEPRHERRQEAAPASQHAGRAERGDEQRHQQRPGSRPQEHARPRHADHAGPRGKNRRRKGGGGQRPAGEASSPERGMQGIPFMTRQSRPARPDQPRKSRPHSQSNSHGRRGDARHPQS
jgi:ATP-dependent RNA helicase RhlE